MSSIDGLATYPVAPFAGAKNRDGEDIVTVEFFMNPMKTGTITWYSQASIGMIPASLRDAANALIAGSCKYALVWRAMYVPAGTYGQVDPHEASGDDQFTAPYGCVSPIQWHALAYRRYLEQYGGRREALATLAVTSRHNANLNQHAIFADRQLAIEDYLNARMISDPLCLFDCDIPVTGCVAAIMTTADRARDLRQQPVFLGAIAQQATVRHTGISYALHDHIDSGRPVAEELWRQSGLSADDMNAAQLYDGFSPSVLYWLEAAGFCGRGEALDFIQDGRISLGGSLPVNTFGGSLSQGRLHGMGHVVEAVDQLRGTAGGRQLPDPSAIVVLDGSPMRRGGGLVLTSDPL